MKNINVPAFHTIRAILACGLLAIGLVKVSACVDPLSVRPQSPTKDMGGEAGLCKFAEDLPSASYKSPAETQVGEAGFCKFAENLSSASSQSPAKDMGGEAGFCRSGDI